MEVGIEDANGAALHGQRRGQIGRQGTFPDAAFATHHGNDRLEPGQPGGYASSLSQNLAENIRVVVGLLWIGHNVALTRIKKLVKMKPDDP
jgi:hypothetical protein